MPGQLKPDAKCPVCAEPIMGLTRATLPGVAVTLEFHHKFARDCVITGPVEPLDKLHDSLHVNHPVICIGTYTLKRLAHGETVTFEDHNVSLIAADDIFHKTIEVK